MASMKEIKRALKVLNKKKGILLYCIVLQIIQQKSDLNLNFLHKLKKNLDMTLDTLIILQVLLLHLLL